MTHQRIRAHLCLIRFALYLGLSLCLSAVPSPKSLGAVVGDRLVIQVNGVPYTQRQIEIYIHIKETLRKTADGQVRLISAGNWSEAVAVFSEDMLVLQESQRLGSFQAPDQALDKYLAIVREKISKGPSLKSVLDRLGANEQAQGRALEEVLRIAAFRRSKERQEEQSKKPEGATKTGSQKWLEDLKNRAMVRRYDNADVYQIIEPTGRGS